MRKWRPETLPHLVVALAFNIAMLVWFVYAQVAYSRAVNCPLGNYMACTSGNAGLAEGLVAVLAVAVWVVGDIVLVVMWANAVRRGRGRPGLSVAAPVSVRPGRQPGHTRLCLACLKVVDHALQTCPHCQADLGRAQEAPPPAL